MRRVLPWICLSLGLVGFGCDDETSSPPQPGVGILAPDRGGDPHRIDAVGFFEGVILDVDTGEPLAGLGVSLFDLVDQSTMPRVETDASGFFRFERVPVGEYLPVVHINGMEVFHLERPRWIVAAGETVSVELRLASANATRGTQYFMRGTVFDAETLAPVAGARVEMNAFFGGSFNWSEYRGSATELEPVTDENGRFELGPLPWIPAPDLEPAGTRIVPSYRIRAEGYRSRAYPESSHPTDLLEVTIRLFPGEDNGVVEGVVVGLDGLPLVGVPVVAEWRTARGVRLRGGASSESDDPLSSDREPVGFDRFDDVVAGGGAVVSDENGRFRIEHLPDGWFVLRAGPFGDDGWIGPTLSGIEILASQGPTEAPPLLAAAAMDLLAPAPGAVVESPPELRWAPVAGARGYRAHLQRAGDEEIISVVTENPFYRTSSALGVFDRDGFFRWTVEALDGNGDQISRADRPRAFSFRAPTSAPSEL